MRNYKFLRPDVQVAYLVVVVLLRYEGSLNDHLQILSWVEKYLIHGEFL